MHLLVPLIRRASQLLFGIRLAPGLGFVPQRLAMLLDVLDSFLFDLVDVLFGMPGQPVPAALDTRPQTGSPFVETSGLPR